MFSLYEKENENEYEKEYNGEELVEEINEILEEYSKKPQLYAIHFTDLEKIGINPIYEYETTPAGIYGYPLKYTFPKYGSILNYPFAVDRKYIFLFFIDNNARVFYIDDNSLSPSYFHKFVSFYEKIRDEIREYVEDDRDLEEKFQEIEEFVEKGTSAKNKELYKAIKNLAYLLSKKTSRPMPHILTYLLRKVIEVDVIVDVGNGLIHKAEPIQMVIFDPRVIKDIKMFKNPVIFKTKHLFKGFEFAKQFKGIPTLEDIKFRKIFKHFVEATSIEERKRLFDYLMNSYFKATENPQMFDVYRKQINQTFDYVKNSRTIFDFIRRVFRLDNKIASILQELLVDHYLSDIDYDEYDELIKTLDGMYEDGTLDKLLSVMEKDKYRIKKFVIYTILTTRTAELAKEYGKAILYILDKYYDLIIKNINDVPALPYRLLNVLQTLYKKFPKEVVSLVVKYEFNTDDNKERMKFARLIDYLFRKNVFDVKKESVSLLHFILPFVLSKNLEDFRIRLKSSNVIEDFKKHGLDENDIVQMAKIWFSS